MVISVAREWPAPGLSNVYSSDILRRILVSWCMGKQLYVPDSIYDWYLCLGSKCINTKICSIFGNHTVRHQHLCYRRTHLTNASLTPYQDKVQLSIRFSKAQYGSV